MIKTAAEQADEQAKQAIEDVKGIRPRPTGNGPIRDETAATSLDQAIVHEATESRQMDADFLTAARRYVEAKQAQAERWKRLLLGAK